MERSLDDQNNGKLIEDYLFSGYQPTTASTTTFDCDQQFAKPIEDDDMFALDLDSLAAQPVKTSSASSKSKLIDMIREQARIKGFVPRAFASDRDRDGMLEFEINSGPIEEQPRADAIFKKAELRRVKNKYGLYKKQKLHWDQHNDYLRRKICEQKRKNWESFQNPPDRYDDEEELIIDPDLDSLHNDKRDKDGSASSSDEEVDENEDDLDESGQDEDEDARIKNQEDNEYEYDECTKNGDEGSKNLVIESSSLVNSSRDIPENTFEVNDSINDADYLSDESA